MERADSSGLRRGLLFLALLWVLIFFVIRVAVAQSVAPSPNTYGPAVIAGNMTGSGAATTGNVVCGNNTGTPLNSAVDCGIAPNAVDDPTTTGIFTAAQWNNGDELVVTTASQTVTAPASSTLARNGNIFIHSIAASTLAANAADTITYWNGSAVTTTGTGGSISLGAGALVQVTSKISGNLKVAGNITGGASTTITLATPGIGSSASTYNPGTQTVTNGSSVFLQGPFYHANTTSCTVNSTCVGGSANDSGYILTPTAASVTYTAPNPGTVGSATYNFGYDGTHSYSITTVGGTATFYGACGAGATTASALTVPVTIVTDGTNYMCFPNGGSGGGSPAFSAITSATNTAAAMVVGSGATLGVSGSGTIAATSVPANGLTGGTLTSGLTAPSLTVTTAFTATGLVTNADLANSGLTLGSTALTLGATTSTVAGLTLTSPTINGGTMGNSTAWTITSGTPTVYVGLDASNHMVTGSPSGVGTVTSVGFSVPATSIFGATGSPVTGAGTLGMTVTGTSGGIPYFDTTSTLNSSALLTNHALLLGGGAGAAPTALGSLGTTTTVLHGNAAGAPTFAAVANADLTNSATTVNGQTCTLGSTCTVTASASGLTVGTTTIGSGTTGDIEFNNAGVLGEKAVTGTGNVVLATAPSVTTLTVGTAFTATGLVTNADLANAATTVNGQTCTLGTTCTVTAAATGIVVGTTTVGSGTGGFVLTDNGGTLGNVALAVGSLASVAANTYLGNPTSGSAAPAATAIAGCSTSNHASQYTTNTGFTCATDIADLDVAQQFTKPQGVQLSTPAISTSTFSLDLSAAQNFKVVLVHASCPCTINFTNPPAYPVVGVLEVDQSSTGSDAVGTWGGSGATVIYPGGVATIALSSAANARDFFSYDSLDGTSVFLTTAGLHAVH